MVLGREHTSKQEVGRSLGNGGRGHGPSVLCSGRLLHVCPQLLVRMSVVVRREKPVYFLPWLGSETWKIFPILHKISNLAHGKAINLATEWQRSGPCDGQRVPSNYLANLRLEWDIAM